MFYFTLVHTFYLYFLYILEVPPDYNFSFIDESETIIRSRYENVKLIAGYTIFPPSADLRAIWEKDGRPIELNFRHTPHHEHSEHQFSLTIPNLSWEDTGLYTIATNISGELQKKSFFLLVEGKAFSLITKIIKGKFLNTSKNVWHFVYDPLRFSSYFFQIFKIKFFKD